jgi:hypothetical protein
MRSLLLTLPLLFANPALAQDTPGNAGIPSTLDGVFSRLAAFETLRGTFTQRRDIPGLSQPLESRGRFIVSEEGLYWEQLNPFRSILIAQEERLVQIVGDQPPTTVSASDRPAASGVGTVFLSVFRGDRAVLEEHFEIRLVSSDPTWRLRLTPRAYPLTETISELVLEGRIFIDELILTGPAGDTLSVRFHDLVDDPPELSPDERALYSP